MYFRMLLLTLAIHNMEHNISTNINILRKKNKALQEYKGVFELFFAVMSTITAYMCIRPSYYLSPNLQHHSKQVPLTAEVISRRIEERQKFSKVNYLSLLVKEKNPFR